MSRSPGTSRRDAAGRRGPHRPCYPLRMRAPFAVAALLLAAAYLPAPVVAADAPFQSEAGGYAVRFPGPPNEKAEAKPSGIRLHFAAAANAERTVSFVVGWGDQYVEAAVEPSRLIDGEINSMLSGGSKLVARSEVKVARLDATAFQIVRKDGMNVHGRILLRPDARLYMMLVMGEEKAAGAAAEPFFASFSLNAPGIPDPPKDPPARRVRFPEAGISVEMHGEPQRKRSKPGEKPEMSTMAAPTRGGFRLEIATYSPIKTAFTKDQEQVLDGIVKGMAKRSGELRELRTIEASGRPGREFRTRIASADAFIRVLMIRGGALTLQFLGPPGTLTAAEATAFFDSLKLEGGKAK